MPGKVQQPNLFYENSTVIAVSWVKPTKPAGPVDYYELIVAHHSGPTNPHTTNGGSSPTALASTLLQENPNNAFYYSECKYHCTSFISFLIIFNLFFFSLSKRVPCTCS